ncbi:Mth938-like domain-containing protein [Elongatibacter sediminis]|uniref:Mth938-like domain-containing protein n=1 Tax=Elongatibacter sediminis TaxID=3119006 RepID=A0AAW9RBJ9_9GAMM
MVDLTLERPGDHLFIRSVGEEGIQVVDDWHTRSIVVGVQRLIADWAPGSASDIEAEHLGIIFELQPEVVIVGTGQRQHFLAPELQMAFLGRGIGVEFMATRAACRTFNILVSEGRNAAAALIPPNA